MTTQVSAYDSSLPYGGVSGELSVVDSPYGPAVVKRALPKLRTTADWRSDPRRSSIEARCLRLLAEVLEPGCVPRVFWVDEAAHSFGMEKLPDRLIPWKARLLGGEVDLGTAVRAGTILGQLHARTSDRTDVAAQFDDRQFLFELRIRPFHERVAERHPDLASAIAHVIGEMLADRRCLVHGDYSPKNLLTDGPQVVVLDCEVAHWGDPRFDVGFCLAHLLLKMMRGQTVAQLGAAAEAFLRAYGDSGLPVLDARLAQATGCLLMARVDGDSPVDYLTTVTSQTAAVALGRSLLLDPPTEPVQAVGRALDMAS
ncbi:MAG: aminoglycoside phosphotransferase family protein [Chloroflexi bacterium]|nr:aminoglycoside phosphotransferase family protein [Chloroflexota bacterium]